MKIFVVACVLYVFSTVLFILSPGLKEAWFLIIDRGDNEHLQDFGNFTRLGLAGFTGYQETHYCSIAVLFCMFLITNEKNTRPGIYFFYMVICFLGSVFYGRTGMLCSILFIGLYLMYRMLVEKDIKLFMALCFFVLAAAAVIAYLVATNDMIKTWYTWAFEPLINLFLHGSFGSGSSKALFNTMYYPLDMSTLIFGEGYFPYGKSGRYFRRRLGLNYNSTDSGIMQPLIFWGLAPTIIRFLLLAVLLILIYWLMKKMYRKFVPLFVLSLTAEWVLFTVKGDIYQWELDLYILMIFLLLLNCHRVSVK
jgi:hypothetical protein